ncbi:BatA domain-containing protein [Vallitalea pronyensis]|uniref:BatA domain-containing protein n=1 Tax=Vallitalea pronyensis TaxID=1348613 RepID=A0A8J8SH72_9FIRM|nr:BatA and WFA domain-containing protein [Vallitalea pronyensis]QUI23112.1 BatA domain-containing protein [Vallitalea pronyensis]
MRFGNPYALWGLLSIPIIILMYILKQNFEEKKVASTFLWDMATKDDEVQTPWQRLRKNILMILQILMAILLVGALAQPYLYQENEVGEAEIIVMDTSASMNAVYDQNMSRLAHAKKSASNRVKDLIDGTPVTLITVGNNVNLIVSGSDDKESVLKAIKAIKPSYGAEKIVDHIPFIRSIAESFEAYGIRVYTDTSIEDEQVYTEIINQPDTNVSLDYMSTHRQENDAIEVLAKVTNRYKKNATVHLQLFTEDDQLLKGQEITLGPRESKSIFLDGITYNGDIIYGEIQEKDLIIEDNKRYSILNKEQTKRVLLVTEGNIFLEKGILATGRYELYKTNTADMTEDTYDLYIFDGIRPVSIPSEGHLMFVNIPEVEGYYTTEAAKKSGLVSFEEHPITKYIMKEQFVASAYSPIGMHGDMQPIAGVGGQPIMAIGQIDGRKYSILSFAIHNSDFPVSMSFPVVMDRLLGHLLGDGSEQVTKYFAGDRIAFEPLSTTKTAHILDPENKKTNLAIQYPTTYYDETQALGLYRLVQENHEQEKKIDVIAVGYHTRLESDIEEVVSVQEKQETKGTNRREQKTDFIKLFIVMALMVSLYEWKKYVKG